MPTDFLTLNNVPIGIHYEEDFSEVTNRIRRRDRMSDASLSESEKAAKRVWEGVTTYVDPDEARMVEDLIDGKGEVWDFTAKYSRHGYGPTADTGYTITGGEAVLDNGGIGFTADLPSTYATAWTMLARMDRFEGSGTTRHHVALTSAGLKSDDGATTAATMTTYMNNISSDNFRLYSFSGAVRDVTYLAVLPYALTQAAIDGWTSAAVDPPDLPFLRLGGSCLRDRYGSTDDDGVEVLCQRERSNIEQVTIDSSGLTDATRIPFEAEER